MACGSFFGFFFALLVKRHGGGQERILGALTHPFLPTLLYRHGLLYHLWFVPFLSSLPGTTNATKKPVLVSPAMRCPIFWRLSGNDQQAVFAIISLQFMAMLFMGILFANTMQPLVQVCKP